MMVRNTDKITNNTSLYIFFGVLPFLRDNGKLDINRFTGIIGKLISFGLVIILLIIDIIFILKDRNKQNYRNYIPRKL